MFKKIVEIWINYLSRKNKDKTMIYLTQATTYFLISLAIALIACYLSIIAAQSSMTPTKVAITFACILSAIQVFIRFLDVAFEGAKYDYDKRNG